MRTSFLGGSRDASTAGRRRFLKFGAAAAVGAAVAPEAAAQGRNAGPRRQFQLLLEHEAAHVPALVRALGANARPEPAFVDFRAPNLAAFIATAQALENTGVGAYLGAAPLIASPAVLAAAGSILAIEARHAGYLNALRSQDMTNNLFGVEQDFETPLTVAQVLAAARPFITGLNGGPEIGYANVRSAENDVNILNFALALEYLEFRFYQTNVPVFFPNR